MSVRASKHGRRGSGSWRRDLPEQHKFEAAIGSIIDHLQPDLAHVHDIFHLGVAARAKSRAKLAGRTMRVVYDAHEYVPGLPSDPRRRAAYTSLEEEYVSAADAVVTVSKSLADLLAERYHTEPRIVMNAPDLDISIDVPSVREVAQVPENAVLAVYVGGVAAHRGAELLLEAFAALDDNVHLVFITNTTSGYVGDLRDVAEASGLGERVHFAPYVAPEGVVDYIRSADLSVIPLSREVLNYEVALPNKLFQSIHAGLPVVVSDNPEMARFVTEHAFGTVFDGRDPSSLAQAVTRIVSDYPKFKGAIESADLTEFTWKAQADILMSVYASLGVGL
jgi:glycosyltransferase involved in cell wall biosynthesis